MKRKQDRDDKKHWSMRRATGKPPKFFPCIYHDKDVPCYPGMLIFCSTCKIRYKHMDTEIAPGKPYTSSIINHCLFDERKATNLANVLAVFDRKIEEYSRHIQGEWKNEK